MLGFARLNRIDILVDPFLRFQSCVGIVSWSPWLSTRNLNSTLATLAYQA